MLICALELNPKANLAFVIEDQAEGKIILRGIGRVGPKENLGKSYQYKVEFIHIKK
ncbi:MAG: hypothetical protein HQL32_17170 [Planctomycetes bacterium]|nr:hypothetical protein [Planctomycetota bacterium]